MTTEIDRSLTTEYLMALADAAGQAGLLPEREKEWRQSLAEAGIGPGPGGKAVDAEGREVSLRHFVTDLREKNPDWFYVPTAVVPQAAPRPRVSWDPEQMPAHANTEPVRAATTPSHIPLGRKQFVCSEAQLLEMRREGKRPRILQAHNSREGRVYVVQDGFNATREQMRTMSMEDYMAWRQSIGLGQEFPG